MFKNKSSIFLWTLVCVQVFCAGIFIANLVLSLFGISTVNENWRLRETLEINASLGLLIGTILGLRMVYQAQLSQRSAESALQNASKTVAALVEEKFNRWGLTEAERDVAWFTVKGFSIKEIAALRGSSLGTIKAHCNGIYRKADVSGRAQLVSTLVEDLFLEAGPDTTKTASEPNESTQEKPA